MWTREDQGNSLPKGPSAQNGAAAATVVVRPYTLTEATARWKEKTPHRRRGISEGNGECSGRSVHMANSSSVIAKRTSSVQSTRNSSSAASASAPTYTQRRAWSASEAGYSVFRSPFLQCCECSENDNCIHSPCSFSSVTALSSAAPDIRLPADRGKIVSDERTDAISIAGAMVAAVRNVCERMRDPIFHQGALCCAYCGCYIFLLAASVHMAMDCSFVQYPHISEFPIPDASLFVSRQAVSDCINNGKEERLQKTSLAVMPLQQHLPPITTLTKPTTYPARQYAASAVEGAPAKSAPACDVSRAAAAPTANTSAHTAANANGANASANAVAFTAAQQLGQAWQLFIFFYADLWIYPLSIAWLATGICASLTALYLHQTHGSFFIASSLLDVRFPVADEDRESNLKWIAAAARHSATRHSATNTALSQPLLSALLQANSVEKAQMISPSGVQKQQQQLDHWKEHQQLEDLYQYKQVRSKDEDLATQQPAKEVTALRGQPDPQNQISCAKPTHKQEYEGEQQQPHLQSTGKSETKRMPQQVKRSFAPGISFLGQGIEGSVSTAIRRGSLSSCASGSPLLKRQHCSRERISSEFALNCSKSYTIIQGDSEVQTVDLERRRGNCTSPQCSGLLHSITQALVRARTLLFQANRHFTCPVLSRMPSTLVLAFGGSLCECLHEMLLLFAILIEGSRFYSWSILVCIAFSELPAIVLLASLLRCWKARFPLWSWVGVALVGTSNTALMLLFATGQSRSLNDERKIDLQGRKTNPAGDFTEWNHRGRVINDEEGAVHRLAIIFALGAAVYGLLANLSHVLCFDVEFSVVSTFVLRCCSQGLIGASGVAYGLLRGTLNNNVNGFSCWTGILLTATAGAFFGPLAAFAFCKALNQSSFFLSTALRSLCWVVVGVLAFIFYGEGVPFTIGLVMFGALAGNYLFAQSSLEVEVERYLQCSTKSTLTDQFEGPLWEAPLCHRHGFDEANVKKMGSQSGIEQSEHICSCPGEQADSITYPHSSSFKGQVDGLIQNVVGDASEDIAEDSAEDGSSWSLSSSSLAFCGEGCQQQGT